MKPARKYYLDQYRSENYWHGGVGYTHMERILDQERYQPVQLPEGRGFVWIRHMRRFLALLSFVWRIKRHDILVFIYPVYGKLNRLLLKWLRRKGVRLICIIGDIDGLKDEDPQLLKKDTRFLLAQQMVIVHNQSMEDWLVSKGYKDHIVQLGFFDFLATPVTVSRRISTDIVFAGNLSKSFFLTQLQQPSLASLRFWVYGKGWDPGWAIPGNIRLMGAFAPDQLPAVVNGSFGLLWDGEDWSVPSDPIGRYMTFITHHKVSLYILAGLPLLVPRVAGVAPLVEQYGIGLVVDHLSDIEPAIKKLSEESYNEMRKKLSALSRQISEGYHLRKALAAVRT